MSGGSSPKLVATFLTPRALLRPNLQDHRSICRADPALEADPRGDLYFKIQHRRSGMRAYTLSLAIPQAFLLAAVALYGQSINSGTVTGTVTDPASAAVPGAKVTLRNPLSGYEQSATTDDMGGYRFTNVPLNPYQLKVEAAGFNAAASQVDVRSSVPLTADVSLQVAGGNTTVTVQAAATLVEEDPSAHVDIDRSQITKLPVFDPGAGLSEAIVYSTGGVAADANGFFHPLGDHAQVSFVIDGQPISDQQSKLISTQLPTSAIQSMEAVTGTPAAEFGDKTSLVANITTRSGLGAAQPFGNLDATYGSFGTTGGSAGIGFGSAKAGNFLTVDGTRS